MACCALAVFLIGQIYGLIAAARTRLRLGRSTAQRAAASAWRPGATAAMVAPRPGFRPRPTSLVYVASFGALAVAIGTFAHATPEDGAAHLRAMLADPIHWCGHRLAG